MTSPARPGALHDIFGLRRWHFRRRSFHRCVFPRCVFRRGIFHRRDFRARRLRLARRLAFIFRRRHFLASASACSGALLLPCLLHPDRPLSTRVTEHQVAPAFVVVVDLLLEFSQGSFGILRLGRLRQIGQIPLATCGCGNLASDDSSASSSVSFGSSSVSSDLRLLCLIRWRRVSRAWQRACLAGACDAFLSDDAFTGVASSS